MKIIDNEIIYEIIDNENIKMKRETWIELLSRIHYLEKRYDKTFNDNIKWQNSWSIQTEKINKAIEYIEKAGLSNYEKELYEILTGSEENENKKD